MGVGEPVAEPEGRTQMVRVLLLPVVGTIKNPPSHHLCPFIHFFPQEKMHVVAASFLTLQLGYVKLDRLACLWIYDKIIS